jgi:hypothetical protein
MNPIELLGLIAAGGGLAIMVAERAKRRREIGKRFEHNEYGRGTLVGWHGKKAIVKFPSGEKMVQIGDLRPS